MGRFCEIHQKNNIFQKPDRAVTGVGNGIQSAKLKLCCSTTDGKRSWEGY